MWWEFRTADFGLRILFLIRNPQSPIRNRSTPSRS
jgi:hypothetical protein